MGQTAGMALLWLFIHFDLKVLFLCAVVSVGLLGIDGFFQLKGLWVSTNSRRLITGMLCGFFVMGFFIRIIAILISKFGV